MSDNELSHSQRLGQFIRAKREEADIGIRELTERSSVSKSTISKLENGLIDHPQTAVLDRIARTLGTSLTEMHTAAGYETSLPSLPVYLRSQYRHLTPEQQNKLTQQVAAVTRRYGSPTAARGPNLGEDESD